MNHPLFLSARRRRLLKIVATAGLVVLAAGVALAPDRVWSNLLVATYLLLTVGLGGAVFLALTSVCGAEWHLAFRRVPETMAKILPIAGGAMILVLAIRMNTYGWEPEHADAGTFWFKALWLTPTFWLCRAGAYVLAWALLAGWLVARSRRQDASQSGLSSPVSTRMPALFLVLFAVTFSLASVDWMMALEPMWFSTMWGVYNFAGLIQAALAVIVILGLILRSPGGPLHGVFRDEHLHDLGKLLLGFSCFWMYIWFSQYMLIWYANIPEETFYFVDRTHGAWGPVVVLSITLNWVIPFFVLLPRSAKRGGGVMMKVAVVVLVGRWVDLYLMVFPSTIGEIPVFGVWEVAAIACLVAFAGLLLFREFRLSSPVAVVRRS